MAKVHFYYNTETCNYERYKASRKEIILNILGFLSVTAIIAVGIIYVYQANFKSLKESRLETENQQLLLDWNILKKEIETAHATVGELEFTDDEIFRVILDTEPIPAAVRDGGTGGHDKYREKVDRSLDKAPMILSTYHQLDVLRKRLYIQSKSYDQISEILSEKEKMWSSRPAIQPINNKELVRIASGFKPKRFNPVLKRWMPHKGIDFTASKGTPVYATGDGVIHTKYRSSSYGNVLFVDHGYGYETRYAHLDQFNVNKGDKVKRGQIIGYVGNTGRSVSAHLHYEILYKGQHINPINFFQRDLSNEAYEKLIEISQQSNEVLD